MTPTKEEEEDVSEFQVKLREKPQKQDDTSLFLNWLESNKIVEFRTCDFVNAVYPQVTKKSADKIMVHQLKQGKLHQMGKDRFMVRRKNESPS